MKRYYVPNTFFSGYDTNEKNVFDINSLPLLTNRISKGKTYFIFVKTLLVFYLPKT